MEVPLCRLLYCHSEHNKVIYYINPQGLIKFKTNLDQQTFSLQGSQTLQFVLSEDIIDQPIVKLSFNIKTSHKLSLQLWINKGEPVNANLQNKSAIIKLIKSSRNTNLTRNLLNIRIDTDNHSEYEINNLYMSFLDIKNTKPKSSPEIINIYNYCYANHLNNNKTTYYQQGKKYRYIFLKQMKHLKNYTILIHSINEKILPDIDPENRDKIMFICNDIPRRSIELGHLDQIHNFCVKMKRRRYYSGYESPLHPGHIWKIKNNYLHKNFNHIYTNHGPIQNPKFHWIPAQHSLTFDATQFELPPLPVINFVHKKFMVNNPCSGSNPKSRDLIIKDIGTQCDFDFYGKTPIFQELFKGHLASEQPFKDILNRGLRKRMVFNQYKFILVCENHCLSGYISEKLVDCLSSGSVPIYFGPENVEIYFPKLFQNGVINGHKYSTPNLLQLLQNMTPSEYQSRLDQIHMCFPKVIQVCSEFAALSWILEDAFRSYKIHFDSNPATEYLKHLNINSYKI